MRDEKWVWYDGCKISRFTNRDGNNEYRIEVPGATSPHYARTLDDAIGIMNEVRERLLRRAGSARRWPYSRHGEGR